uniref:Phage protein n=1 Tax=Panagrolaimus superbus TaxID=310955 RepID=A0A914XW34_9BILA
MPNVRWHIKCYPEDPRDNGYIGVYLNIQSETEISYIIDNVVNKFIRGHEKRLQNLRTIKNLAKKTTIICGNDEYRLELIQGYTGYSANINLIVQVRATFTKK